jgi:GNAT superfamily N-acetyltransferase
MTDCETDQPPREHADEALEPVRYDDSLEGIAPADLEGFFVGWPDPPPPATRLEILRAADEVLVARRGDRVVGFVTAITDGILTAYLPLLEVLPDEQGRGIGSELTERMLGRLDHLYMIDLVCDDDLVPFYERFGMLRLTAMGARNYAHQSGAAPRDTTPRTATSSDTD